MALRRGDVAVHPLKEQRRRARADVLAIDALAGTRRARPAQQLRRCVGVGISAERVADAAERAGGGVRGARARRRQRGSRLAPASSRTCSPHAPSAASGQSRDVPPASAASRQPFGGSSLAATPAQCGSWAGGRRGAGSSSSPHRPLRPSEDVDDVVLLVAAATAAAASLLAHHRIDRRALRAVLLPCLAPSPADGSIA